MNREQLNSVRVGLDVAYALQRLYPGKINFEACRFLIGSREVVDAAHVVHPRAPAHAPGVPHRLHEQRDATAARDDGGVVRAHRRRA